MSCRRPISPVHAPPPPQSPALRYPLHGADHSESALRTFMAEFAAGTLTAFVKSAPPPAVNDGPVRVIVGSTLAAETSDATKDVLVEVRVLRACIAAALRACRVCNMNA